MTGYGRGEASNGEISVLVEMKSVNNRFCDVNTRLPRLHAARISSPASCKGRIQRGRVDVFVRRKAPSRTDDARGYSPCAKGVPVMPKSPTLLDTRRPHQRHPNTPVS